MSLVVLWYRRLGFPPIDRCGRDTKTKRVEYKCCLGAENKTLWKHLDLGWKHLPTNRKPYIKHLTKWIETPCFLIRFRHCLHLFGALLPRVFFWLGRCMETPLHISNKCGVHWAQRYQRDSKWDGQYHFDYSVFHKQESHYEEDKLLIMFTIARKSTN